MLNWNNVAEITARDKSYNDTRKLVTPQNYGFSPGNWNISDAILDSDSRKFFIYMILDGVTPRGKRHAGMMPLQEPSGGNFLFKLRVLSRQACCRDADGNKIHESDESLENLGVDTDILPEYFDKPAEGDIVEWKGAFKQYDSERGKKVNNSILREWAAMGIRPEEYVEFTVDSDGCIMVPYPFVQSMLRKKGERLTFPKFGKINRASRSKRKLTNWWFKEVPRDYKSPKQKRK
jgi:hypothetical protein